ATEAVPVHARQVLRQGVLADHHLAPQTTALSGQDQAEKREGPWRWSAKPSSRVRFPPSPQFPNESQVLSRVGQRSIKPLPRDQFVFWRFQSPLTRAGQKSSPERPRSAGQKSLGHGGLA